MIDERLRLLLIQLFDQILDLSFELLVKDLRQYKKNGYQVILLSGSHTRAKL